MLSCIYIPQAHQEHTTSPTMCSQKAPSANSKPKKPTWRTKGIWFLEQPTDSPWLLVSGTGLSSWLGVPRVPHRAHFRRSRINTRRTSSIPSSRSSTFLVLSPSSFSHQPSAILLGSSTFIISAFLISFHYHQSPITATLVVWCVVQ